MASSFLEQRAREQHRKMALAQAEKLEKQYGSSAYGGTTWLNEQINGKKKKKKEDDDIAPVRSTTKKDEDERKWFEKGAFEDGYQFGDVFKTLLGTENDILQNMKQGALKFGENVIDAGATAVGFVGEKFGADGFAEKTKDFVKKDLTSEVEKFSDNAAAKILKGATAPMLRSIPGVGSVVDAAKGITAINRLINGEEDNSVLGEKSDALVQSGTQFAMQMGLSYAGVPWYLTAGVTSFGGEAEGAFNEGATYNEAALSGVISAGGEILTEKLFGGSGLGEKGLINLEPLTKGITNKVVKALADYGVDLFSEGAEEVVSQVIGNLGSALYKEENLMDILTSEEAIDGYIESFIGGAVISGGANVGKVSSSIKSGRDYRTGLSDNEQKVVDKEVENRIAEQEKDGKKLTAKEKAVIEDKVVSDMERGYITTDTIEEVLGGETYKTHRDTLDSEKAMQEEYDALYRMKNGDKSDAQIDRQAELKQKLEDIKQNFNRNQLGDEVMSMVKGDRLVESYNERYRRGQAFEADISKYDAKQQATIQKAIDSGILNNTNRTHEFVDMIAKISADKGVSFDFTNNEKLKESGFAVEGKTVNGYVTADGVTLNIDSAKSLNSVVGHEIAHVLEGTEMYQALQSVLKEYATTKGEYQTRYDALAETYKNIDGADIDAELTADLVGDYLFADPDFIKHLSVTDRNLFQKIYDEIKYLYKIATAGSKELRELEKVKKLFEDAYRATKNTDEDSGTKYSVETLPDGKKYVRADRQVIFGNDPASWSEQVESYINGKIRNGENISLVAEDGDVLVLTADSAGKIASNKTSHGTTMADDQFFVKANAGVHIDELAQASVNDNPGKKPKADVDSRHGTFAEGGWTYRTAFFLDFDGKYYRLKISAAKGKDGNVVYNIGDIKERSFPKVTGSSAKGGALNGKASSGGNLSQDVESVNRKFSLSDSDGKQLTKEQQDYFKDSNQVKSVANENPTADKDIRYSLSEDSKGRELSKEQQEFFKDSKIRVSEVDGWKNTITENGALFPVYHGTNSGEFFEFDKDAIGSANDHGWFGKGFYFAFTEGEASYYGNRVLECYLDVKKPFIYADEMGTFDGRDSGDVNFDFAAFIINMSDKFPDIAQNISVRVAEHGSDETVDKSFPDFANEIKELYDSNRLKVVEIGDGDKTYYQYRFSGDVDSIEESERIKKIIKEKHIDGSWMADWYREKGEITQSDYDEIMDLFEKYGYDQFSDTWIRGRYDTKEQAEKARLSAVIKYLSDSKYSYVEQHMDHYYMDSYVASDFSEELRKRGYDGIIQSRFGDEIVVFDSNQIKLTSNRKPTNDPDIRRSLSNVGETPDNHGLAPANKYKYSDVYGKDIALETAPVEEAPVREDVAENATTTEELFPDDFAPISDDPERFDSLTDEDAPPVRNVEYGEHGNQMTMPKSTVNMIAQNVKASLWVEDGQMGDVRKLIEEYGNQEFPSREQLFRDLKDNFGTHTEKMTDEVTQEVKRTLRRYRLNVSDAIKSEIPDYGYLRQRNFGKVLFSRQGMPVDVAYEELSEMYPGYFPKDIINPTDQLMQIIDVANRSHISERTYELDDETVWDITDDIIEAVRDYQSIQRAKDAGRTQQDYLDDLVKHGDEYAPVVRPSQSAPFAFSTSGDLAPTYDAQPSKGVVDGQQAMFKDEPVTEEERKQTRKQLHQGIVANIKETFKNKGFDFDKVLKKAKNLSTWSTVDNMPQRVMEKALGYKEGQVLSDLTVNKVAQNETEGIKWLNSFTDRKSGLLKQISDKYHIKPGSKESAAAQMYAEGFYVGENNDIISYGDAELAKDFPDPNVQRNIKGLANDPRIRQIYDDTLEMINESRTRNAYPEIQKLDNYFLHFRAMDDTFSRLGLPFNPNDIRAKDLPTDLNGVTADLKPGQPYFASAMHRTGKRTSFDLLGGLERYLNSAKNQIYHIDDIQTLRALRNYIADTYGQANGLEGLDALSEEEAQERIEQVYNSHLSTFAKFLNEEANILAGKTALIDRGLEGIIGRRGITFLDTVNKQVGSNMVGFNISSSLTNFLPVAQTFAKTNKADFVKAFSQTVANKLSGGRFDSFADDSPVVIRRKGADRLYRTPWQKAGDVGYVFMSAVDDISTEIIARTKYNELTRKGMDAQQAHYETDKWVSRLMGDRSLGQMPQLYNSKMLGLFTKFQLEVRNQLDAQFYDTIQEAKVSNEHIENGLARNAKIAAKVTSTFVQLAVAQHLFGKAFESVAGYNPAFDIISVLMTAFGFDDEEDSEDTALDNIEQGFLELLGDLPYTSTLTGGRIPISSALPITELVKGEDQWGNDKSRWKTLGEIAPYYVLPGGYGQIKKTKQGLEMFSDDLPIAGSYTASGNLRFPVEDTFGNRVQAGIFGQWASENARDYFDNERSPLKEKQIQEFMNLDIPIRDYWEYREGLSGLSKLEDKADYIAGLDLPIDKKNMLINNIADREEDIDLSGYDDFGDFEEFDFAVKNPEKYEIAKKVGGFDAYMEYQEGMKDMKLAEKVDYVAGLNLTDAQKNALINGETDRKEPIDLTGYNTSDYSGFEEFEFAKEYPEKYAVAKAVGGYEAYKGYSDELYDIKADKDKYGKSISGSRKKKVLDYINNLDADYYTRIILWKSEYPSDDSYNHEIIEYLNGRDDLSFEETIAALRKLGFNVTDDGHITW